MTVNLTVSIMNSDIFFNKKEICCIADIHIGVHQNGTLWHKIALEWVEWFDKQLKKKKIKDIIIAGDLFHYRDEIAVNTIHVVTKFFNVLKDYNIVILVGNHDADYKDRSDVSSLSILSGWDNITIIDEVLETTSFGRKLAFCPWGVRDKDIPNADIIFGHFELQNFKYNFARACSHGLQAKQLLKKAPNIITGHFHIRQAREYDQGRVTYVGNPFQMDFGDAGDQKGYYILDLETAGLKFYKNNLSPKHFKVFLSKILDDDEYEKTKKHIPNNFIKFIVDQDIGPDFIEQYINEISNLQPRTLNVDYQVNFNKLKFDDGEQELSCVNIESAIEEFVDLLEIDNKKDVAQYTLELYKRCS